MERWKVALATLTDLGKVVGLVVGCLAVAASIVHGVAWASNLPDGRVLTTRFLRIEGRQDLLEANATNDREWRRWMVDQVSAISRHVGAPVAPPPSDATR